MFFYADYSFSSSENKEFEIIIAKDDVLVEQYEVLSLENDEHVKRLLKREGITPNTTNWLEVTSLCEKDFTHLKQDQLLCIYNKSKIIDKFDKTKAYCKQERLKGKMRLDKCYKKYGFSDKTHWQTYKNPLEKNLKEKEKINE